MKLIKKRNITIYGYETIEWVGGHIMSMGMNQEYSLKIKTCDNSNFKHKK
jgi:hypothetical protein